MKAAKKDTVAAKKALGEVKYSTAEEKKANKDKYEAAAKALGEAVDKDSGKTTYKDLVAAQKAVVDSKAAMEAFYCDAAKLDFPLFTEKDCTKAVTKDGQKLPAGFDVAVTSGQADAAKACVKTGADKGTKSVKVLCELKAGKASITVASFSDVACANAVQKDSKDVSSTIAEGTCSANDATPSTWIKVGPKAAAAEEGMGVGMIILIVVICVVVCAALYFVKTKFFPGNKGE